MLNLAFLWSHTTLAWHVTWQELISLSCLAHGSILPLTDPSARAAAVPVSGPRSGVGVPGAAPAGRVGFWGTVSCLGVGASSPS